MAEEQPQAREKATRGDCRNAVLLSDSDIEAMIAQFPRWKLSDDKKSISRSFVAKDFVEAMKFFNQVAEAAEAQNHHPENVGCILMYPKARLSNSNEKRGTHMYLTVSHIHHTRSLHVHQVGHEMFPTSKLIFCSLIDKL
ncbi:hypothetical protein O6H91_03G009800 [Diphasiastrum complanatum]|uniref:Uncharacterized protein n=1 Tax=Diphasiastrum complanatum TaxID=34168 RepID=A0ACC2E3P0_DIPCM|nr:hypothetical protein O6H91_03G009800 [Diphasiastrum complanatum]